eukprot:5374383-Amphidinium_carterae.1
MNELLKDQSRSPLGLAREAVSLSSIMVPATIIAEIELVKIRFGVLLRHCFRQSEVGADSCIAAVGLPHSGIRKAMQFGEIWNSHAKLPHSSCYDHRRRNHCSI